MPNKNANMPYQRLHAAWCERYGWSARKSKDRMRKVIDDYRDEHPHLGPNLAIEALAQEHQLDISLAAHEQRRGMIPVAALHAAGLLTEGDKLSFTQAGKEVVAHVGAGGTLLYRGHSFTDPRSVLESAGCERGGMGLGTWQRWTHSPTGKTLFQLGKQWTAIVHSEPHHG